MGLQLIRVQFTQVRPRLDKGDVVFNGGGGVTSMKERLEEKTAGSGSSDDYAAGIRGGGWTAHGCRRFVLFYAAGRSAWGKQG